MQAPKEAKQSISLLDALDQDWIKMPLTIMQDVGPAVQTLGGLLKITNRETFVPVARIAPMARLPVKTIRQHLARLNKQGWIHNRGRERTRRGHLRRTATIVIPKKTKDRLAPFGVLPWWACCHIRNAGWIPWCAQAVLSLIVARLCGLKAAVERDEGSLAERAESNAEAEADDGEELETTDFDAAGDQVERAALNEMIEEFRGALDNMGGDERFRFSLDYLVQQTGLSRPSVVTAKRFLTKHGVIQWLGSKPKRGQNTKTDMLVPNWGFRVVVTPASPGRVWLDFGRR